MIGESQGVKSFRRWSDLEFPRQFMPQELLCLSNRADGSLVMLPVAELSEEERQAPVTAIRQFISAAKAGTGGEPLPPPEGYGEAFSLYSYALSRFSLIKFAYLTCYSIPNAVLFPQEMGIVNAQD